MSPDPAPAAEPQMSTQEIVDSLYAFAAERLMNGTPPDQIERELMDRGLDAEAARIIVSNLQQARAKAMKEAGQKNMLFGALWCIGGIIVTAVTYQAAIGGGSYVVAWGAILFGAIQFFRGLSQSAGS
jgi:hypothetical protein